MYNTHTMLIISSCPNRDDYEQIIYYIKPIPNAVHVHVYSKQNCDINKISHKTVKVSI